MKKKFISVLLSFSLLCGMCAYAESQDIDEGDKKAVEVIKGMGIMKGYDDGEFYPNRILTRAEFAACISALLTTENIAQVPLHNTDEWEREFYGTTYNKDSENDFGEELQISTFWDVPPEHWAFNVVNIVSDSGIMHGVGGGKFEPDREISVNEAIKVIVNILGYSAIAEDCGGYPSGYVKTAYDLGILGGIDMNNQSAGMKRSQIAKLFYNSRDVRLMKLDFSDKKKVVKSEETLFSSYRDTVVVQGVVTDNGFTTALGSSEVGRDEVVIANIKMKIPEHMQSIRDEIGMRVEAYYRTENDENTLVYFSELSDSDTIMIDASDIDSFTSDKITYSNNGSSSVRVERIPANMRFIYNGSSVSSLTEEMMNITSGYVRITRGTNPIMFIKNYRTVLLGTVDKENKEIADKLNLENPITYDEEKLDKKVIIKSIDGKTLSESDLEDATVLMLCEGNKSIEFVIGYETINCVVDSVDFEEKAFVADGVKYEICKELLTNNMYRELKMNDNVKLFLNADGKVAWIEEELNSEAGYGYVYRCYADKKGSWKIKIYSSRGIHEVYEIRDKLTIKDSDNQLKTYKLQDYDARLTDFKGFVSYELDSEQKVKRINLPLADEDKNELHKIYEITPSVKDMLMYKTSLNSFGWKVNVNKNTSFIGVPENVNDETRDYIYPGELKTKFSKDDFKTFSLEDFRDNKNYSITGYSLVANSTMADFVVCYGEPVSEISVDDQIGIVTEVLHSVDEDGEPCTKIKMVYQRNEKTYTEGNGIDFTRISTDIGSGRSYEIKRGDCVRFVANSKNEILSMSLVYDADATNPSGGSAGYLADAGEKYYVAERYIDLDERTSRIYEYARMGNEMLCGDGNPYSSSEDIPAYHTKAQKRVILGYALSSDGLGVKITTQDMTKYSRYYENGIPTNARVEDGKVGIFITENLPLNNVQIDHVTIHRKNVEVRPGAISDIKTYEDAGNRCSKLLVIAHYGDIRQVVVIENDL